MSETQAKLDAEIQELKRLNREVTAAAKFWYESRGERIEDKAKEQLMEATAALINHEQKMIAFISNLP